MSAPILSPELRAVLADHPGRPVRLVDPETKTEYVLVPAEIFDRLAPGDYDYDDSPWTNEENLLLAAQAGRAIGWDDMDEYDNYPDDPK